MHFWNPEFISTHSKCHKIGYNDDDPFLDAMDNIQPMSKYVAKKNIFDDYECEISQTRYDIPSNFHPIICFNM